MWAETLEVVVEQAEKYTGVKLFGIWALGLGKGIWGCLYKMLSWISLLVNCGLLLPGVLVNKESCRDSEWKNLLP